MVWTFWRGWEGDDLTNRDNIIFINCHPLKAFTSKATKAPRLVQNFWQPFSCWNSIPLWGMTNAYMFFFTWLDILNMQIILPWLCLIMILLFDMRGLHLVLTQKTLIILFSSFLLLWHIFFLNDSFSFIPHFVSIFPAMYSRKIITVGNLTLHTLQHFWPPLLGVPGD